MADKDGDKIYNDIVEIIKSGKDITKQDIISLTFTPIMGGKIGIADKIINAIQVVKDINNDYKNGIESILYAFANKFLSGRDLEKVKEELRMTELGKSLIEEGMEKGMKKGMEKGIKEGREEGKSELLIKMLIKKFKKLPDEYKKKINHFQKKL